MPVDAAMEAQRRELLTCLGSGEVLGEGGHTSQTLIDEPGSSHGKDQAHSDISKGSG